MIRIKTQQITTDAELAEAIRLVNELVDLGFDNLTSDQDSLLKSLADQIESYETTRYPDEPITQPRMLRSLLDNRGMTVSELARKTDVDEATILAVLMGNRILNDPEKATIAQVFCVGPQVFD